MSCEINEFGIFFFFLATCHVNLPVSVVLSSSWSCCPPHQPSPCLPPSLPATRRYPRRRWTCPARRSPSTRAGTTKTRRGERLFGGLIFLRVSRLPRCVDSHSPSPTAPPPRRHVSASFQDCSSDGPGQPGVQETPETENILQEKEAQDQGSTLRPQSRLSEVRGRHSCMSQLIPTLDSQAGLEEYKPPDNKSTL